MTKDDCPFLDLSLPGVSDQVWPVSLSLSPLQKERRLLQNRRLDLDACKARLKKAKAAEAKATVSAPAPSLLPGSAGESRGGVFRNLMIGMLFLLGWG